MCNLTSLTCNASEDTRHRKILEEYYIKLFNKTLNEKLDNNNFDTFRNEIT